MFDNVIDRSISEPVQPMDARILDVRLKQVNCVFKGKGWLDEMSLTHCKVAGNYMTILEPDFMIFLDANVMIKLPVLLTVLLSKVAFT
jgi:hypothetical protein